MNVDLSIIVAGAFVMAWVARPDRTSVFVLWGLGTILITCAVLLAVILGFRVTEVGELLRLHFETPHSSSVLPQFIVSGYAAIVAGIVSALRSLFSKSKDKHA